MTRTTKLAHPIPLPPGKGWRAVTASFSNFVVAYHPMTSCGDRLAERLVVRLDRAGFFVMKRPAEIGAAKLGRSFRGLDQMRRRATL
jgi:hypothetical protein